jgi:hypothetical protein
MPSTVYGPSGPSVPVLTQSASELPTGSASTTWASGSRSLIRLPTPVIVPPVPDDDTNAPILG